MRQIKRISFLIYSCLLVAAGFYGHMKYVELFYPGSLRQSAAQYQKEELRSAPVAATSAKITFDTELVTLCYDASTQETVQSAEAMPEKYVGMEREDFVRCMQSEAEAPALSERKKGLYAIEVQSFSAQRVVIQRSYREQSVAEAFFLALRRNMVVVYEEDKNTVYMQTAIDGRSLPPTVRDELMRGMTIDGNEKLEEFLAQYSSALPAE